MGQRAGWMGSQGVEHLKGAVIKECIVCTLLLYWDFCIAWYIGVDKHQLSFVYSWCCTARAM